MKKKFTLRDFFTIARFFKKIDIKDEFIELVKEVQNKNGVKNEVTQGELGVKMMLMIFDKLTTDTLENELYITLGKILDHSAEEIQSMELVALVDLLLSTFSLEEWENLGKRLKAQMQLNSKNYSTENMLASTTY